MRALVLTIVILGTMPAMAADTIVLSPNPCAPLAAYTPSDDVRFQPDIDAYGRAVTPAKLPDDGGPNISAQAVDVVIEVPIIKSQGGDSGAVSPRDFEATVEIGTVTVDADGTARLDGIPLAPPRFFPSGCSARP